MPIKTVKYDIENLPVLNTDIGTLEFQPIPFNISAIDRLEKEYQSIVFASIRPNGDLMLFDTPPVYSGDKTYPWETSDEFKTESVPWKKSSPYTTDAVMSRFWKNYIDRTYWESVKILGYEVAETGVAEVTRVGTGDITTMEIIDVKTEVKTGDLVLPIDDFNFDPYFMPKAGTVEDDNIRVVALNNALFGSGRRQVVAISHGYGQGINVGDVYSVYSPEKVIRDEVMHPKNDLKTLFQPSKAKVTLPMEYSGHIMVFKTFENISYAIITEGNRQVKLYDYVKLP